MSRQPTPQQPLLHHQQQQHGADLQEHAQLLDQLHNSVLNTRHYAVQIGSELQEQEGMLDALHGNVTRTADEGRRQNRNVVQLLAESKNRGFYLVVIVLCVILLVLLVL